MKKKFFFIFLSFILSFTIIYILIFLYTFLNISYVLKYNYIKSKEELIFYKKYSKIVHHLRDPFIYSKKINNKDFTNYIFTYIEKNDLKETILFQGDSWFEQIDTYAEASSQIKSKFNNNYNIINAGTTSYSPSLFSVQYDLLKKKFNINPDYIIAYIDQTDFYDENCRYKGLKISDSNNNLIAVPYEEYPYYQGQGIDLLIKHSEIGLYKNNFLKTYFYLNYRLKKAYNKISKAIQVNLTKENISGKCKKIEYRNFFDKKKNDEIYYFLSSLSEYLTKLTNDQKIKKIFLISHPHKIHVLDENLLNISNLIDELIEGYNKVEHINFTNKIIKNPNLYIKINDIWLNDLIHLNRKTFSEIFITEVLNDIINKIN